MRSEMGISQREAAEKVGTTARVWQNMEDGRAVRGLPAIIGTRLGCDDPDLHGDPGRRPSPGKNGRRRGGLTKWSE